MYFHANVAPVCRGKYDDRNHGYRREYGEKNQCFEFWNCIPGGHSDVSQGRLVGSKHPNGGEKQIHSLRDNHPSIAPYS